MSDPAELLRDFVNTYDVEKGADELAAPAELTAWLREHGLIAADDRASEDDLTDAVALREGLRAALRRDHDRAGRVTGDLLAALPLRVDLGRAVPALEPVAGGARGGLARLAAAVIEAHAAGTWSRLKVCGEDTCQWAFVDSSKNRSRSWCSMRVCGNRTKTRAYRARHRGAGPVARS